METSSFDIVTPEYEGVIKKNSNYLKGLESYYSRPNKLIQIHNRIVSTSILDISDISYRQRNSWEEKGVFELDREGGWRKFSYMDAIWLLLIKDLRGLGVPISSIVKVKEYIMSRSKEYGVKYPFLEYGSFLALHKGFWVYLYVFQGGISVILDESEVARNDTYLRLEPHVRVCLNSVFARYVTGFNLNFADSKIVVSHAERELISFLRQELFDEITIKSKEGKLTSFETSKWVNANDITKIDVEYGAVTFEKVKGQTVKAKIVKKKKITTENKWEAPKLEKRL